MRLVTKWLSFLCLIHILQFVRGKFDLTVSCWNAIELSFNATGSYSNPYLDIEDFTATFISSSGISMIMPGFWDGGKTWKIRFAPTSIGLWNFTTRSNDTGLDNHNGSILSTSYTGSLEIYKHGFLRPSTNNRYLAYADDKPFYWLGDTHWSGFNIAERLNQSNDIRFHSMFKGMIDRRIAQGFTVWKAETFANNNEGGNPPSNEGGPAWGHGGFFIDLNPDFWQNIDQRIQYLASHGMIISMAQGIGRSMKNMSSLIDHKRLARYILARYGAYPTVWITAQEYNDAYSGACGPCWAEVASFVFDLDPYKRANSMHNAATNPISYHDQPWYSFVTLQQAHNRVNSVDYWLEQYNAQPARPILEDEANYEDIIPPYGGGSITPKWKTRQSAWQSQIAGTFGFTYGAQGIWWGCYTEEEPNFNCGSGSEARAWNVAIDFPVGEEMSLMAQFWTSIDWWTLSPDKNAIQWHSAPNDTQQPFQKTDGNQQSLIIAYLPLQLSGTVYTGTVQNLSPRGLYKAQWFNPRNGTYSIIEQGWTLTKQGQWNIPNQPTSDEDWVLQVQRTSTI